MVKDILEVSGIVLALILSLIAVVKFWSGSKTAKEFSSDIGKTYDRMREVEQNVVKALNDCQAKHDDCAEDVKCHLRDLKMHRDPELETFRYNTLAGMIGDLKSDLSTSIGQMDSRLCDRIGKLETAFRNGAK
jgi:hypothetical protein